MLSCSGGNKTPPSPPDLCVGGLVSASESRCALSGIAHSGEGAGSDGFLTASGRSASFAQPRFLLPGFWCEFNEIKRNQDGKRSFSAVWCIPCRFLGLYDFHCSVNFFGRFPFLFSDGGLTFSWVI